MKKTLNISASALFLVLTLATAETAAASPNGWSFGNSFRLGDVEFSLGFHKQSPDNFYWRTRVDLGRTYHGRVHRYAGCDVRDGYHYHGRNCPLIRSFFSYHGHDVNIVFATYSPSRRNAYPRHERYDRNDGYAYDGYGRNDRYDRYPNSRRYRYDDWRGQDYRYRRGSSCPNR